MRNFEREGHRSSLYQNNLRPQGTLTPPPGTGPVRYPTTPSPMPSPRKPERKRLELWMIFMLGLAVVLIIAGVVAYMIQQNGSGPGIAGTNNHTTGTNGTPAPTATTLSEHQRYQQLAEQYVSKMSLEDMIGQLMFVNDDPTVTTDDDLRYMIQTQHIGGILVHWTRLQNEANNYANDPVTYADPKTQIQNDIKGWMQGAKTPLFIATEDEGGYVRRLTFTYPDYKPPSALQIGQSGDPTVATTEGTKMADHLKELTFNTTFTPVSEVAVLKDGYLDYNERCFGYTVNDVVKYAGPYLAAMQKDGIIGTLKHFPGTGRIDQNDDPHYVLPTVDASKEEYYNTDMAPFKQLIQSQDTLEHPGFIMTTYVLVPSIDPDYPAQYSSKFVDGILRKEFGYDGVVITDSLTVMQGNQINRQTLTIDGSVIAALKAGDDMMLGITSSDQIDLITTKIKEAIQQGQLTQDRIKESAIRVITLKLERKIMTETAS